MLCSQYSLVKYQSLITTITPLRCRCWTCDECRPARKARLVKEAKQGAPTIFITLTSRRTPGGSPDKAARVLVLAWRKVRAEYLKKNGKKSLPFLAVFEATKQGWPHIHIVARARWIDQAWLSKRMASLAGAPIVDVRKIKGLREVAGYIAKYIGKNPSRFLGTKRYWRSLDYLAPTRDVKALDAEPPPQWRIEKCSWLMAALLLTTEGYTVIYDESHQVATAWKPP